MKKFLSESNAIVRLDDIRRGFAQEIQEQFEHNARPCSYCKTPGACCLDEHFVNVRISRLEAAGMKRALAELPQLKIAEVGRRTNVAVEKYALLSGGENYACPLYEKGVGCLVHETAKPLPCIAHACYERKEDLPPDELLGEREVDIDRLNRRVYGKSEPLQPIPVALGRLLDLPADDRHGDQQT